MQGTVNKINFNGKAYSAEINGTWYGAGFDKPEFNEGDVLEFDIRMNGKFKNLDKAKVLGSAAQGTVAAAPAGKPDPQVWVDKDNSILYQSCRKDAIAFVGVLLANQLVALPAKKGDQCDAVQALVEDYTVQFFIKTRDVVQNGGCTLEDLVPQQ